MFNNVYTVRAMSGEWGVRPMDMLMVQKEVTLDSDKEADIDLKGIVKKGSPVFVQAFQKITTDGTTGIAAFDADPAEQDVMVAIFFEPQFLAESGE
jgi:hypothetical protein